MNDRHGVRTLQANWCACGLAAAMLLPELEVFAAIYRHRLQPHFDAGACDCCVH